MRDQEDATTAIEPAGERLALTRRSLMIGAAAGAAGAMIGLPALAQTARTIRFLHDETDPPTLDFFQKAIAVFEKDNPGVTVEMEAVGTAGRLQKVAAMMNAGTMPEIFKILPEERFLFGKKGYLEPLDDVLSSIGEDEYEPRMIARQDGKLLSIPYTIGHSSVMWYRDDLLSEKGLKAPENWDEFLSNAAAMTVDTDNDGVVDQFGTVFPVNKNRVTSLYFSQMYWSAGGTYFDKDFNLVFGGEPAVKTLEFLKALSKSAPAGISNYANNDLVNAYLTGKVAMDIWAGRLISNAVVNQPGLIPKTKAARRPAGPSGIGIGFSNANSFAIASESVGGKNLDVAKKFLTYILTGDRAIDFALTAYPHLIPPTKSIRSSPRLLAGTPELADRRDLAEVSFDITNTLDFESEAGAVIQDGKVVTAGVINPYIGAIIARDVPAQMVQRVVLQDQVPQEAIQWATKQMTGILANARKG